MSPRNLSVLIAIGSKTNVGLALRATGQRNLPAVKIAVTALNSSGGSGSSSE